MSIRTLSLGLLVWCAFVHSIDTVLGGDLQPVVLNNQKKQELHKSIPFHARMAQKITAIYSAIKQNCRKHPILMGARFSVLVGATIYTAYQSHELHKLQKKRNASRTALDTRVQQARNTSNNGSMNTNNKQLGAAKKNSVEGGDAQVYTYAQDINSSNQSPANSKTYKSALDFIVDHNRDFKKNKEISGVEMAEFKRLLALDMVDGKIRQNGRNSLLHNAVLHNNADVIIQSLVDWDSESINAVDENGDTPLHYTGINYQIGWRTPVRSNMVRPLLACGADVNRKNNKGQTPLFVALSDGHLNTVQEILSYNVELQKNITDTGLPPVLAQLAKEYCVDFDINATDTDGKTALYHVLSSTHSITKELVALLSYLLGLGADINQHYAQGNTPLMQEKGAGINNWSVLGCAVDGCIKSVLLRNKFEKDKQQDPDFYFDGGTPAWAEDTYDPYNIAVVELLFDATRPGKQLEVEAETLTPFIEKSREHKHERLADFLTEQQRILSKE